MVPENGVGFKSVGLYVVTFYFFPDFVSAALVFIFDIEDWIYEVLALEWAKTILQAEAGEERAVVEGGLAIEIEFGGPPRGRAIFQFHPEGMVIVAEPLGTQGGEVFDFEIAGLFQVVIVSDDIRTFLGA